MFTGDIILVSGKTFISRMIQKVTGSKWTHVAVYIGAGRVLEIDWNTPTQLTENKYTTGDFDYLVLRPRKRLTKEQSFVMIERALDLNDLGAKYDWKCLFSLFMEKKFPKLKWAYNSKNDYVCTELTDIMFKEIGIDLFPDFDGNIYPHYFLNSPALMQLPQKEKAAA